MKVIDPVCGMEVDAEEAALILRLQQEINRNLGELTRRFDEETRRRWGTGGVTAFS